MKRHIYLASSWRNAQYQQVLELLRAAGHEVYDFRNPTPGERGFSWDQLDPNWQGWTPRQFMLAMESSIARSGFDRDKTALDLADTCVLLLPCGKSAHLEAGYAIGRGKPTLIVLAGQTEPELMYLLAGSPACVVADLIDILPGLNRLPRTLKNSAAI